MAVSTGAYGPLPVNASAGADVEASVAGEEGPDELEAATTGGTAVVAEQGDVVVVVDVSPVVDVVSAAPVVEVVLGDDVVVGSPVVVVAMTSWGAGDVVVVEVVVVVVEPVVDEVLVLGAGAAVVVLVEVPVVQSVVVVVPAWSGVVEVVAVVDVDGIVDVVVAEVEVVVSAATASGPAAQQVLTPVPASVLPGPAMLDIGLALAPAVKPMEKLVAMAAVLIKSAMRRLRPGNTDRCRRGAPGTDRPGTDPCGTGAPARRGHSTGGDVARARSVA